MKETYEYVTMHREKGKVMLYQKYNTEIYVTKLEGDIHPRFNVFQPISLQALSCVSNIYFKTLSWWLMYNG